MWKLRPGKKKFSFSGKISSATSEKKRSSIPFVRSSSGATLKDVPQNGDDSPDVSPPVCQYRSRSHTFTSGVPPKVEKKSSKSSSATATATAPTQAKAKCPWPEDTCSSKEDMLSSPRHFFRRRALVESEMEEDITSSRSSLHNLLIKQSPEEPPGTIMVTVEDGDSRLKELITVQGAQSLRSLLAPLLPACTLAGCEVLATSSSDSSVPVDLDAPSTQYATCKVHVNVKTQPQEDTSAVPANQQQLTSLQECLDYFQQHGLVELPKIAKDDNCYHLPRVPPTEPIASLWEELPISQQAKDSLTRKALDQQQAVWELIYTEHSYLKQLEVIINLFMRCLELLRRANILTEDSYHNIFGYMEDVYNAHEQFWTWTLQPCLEKVYETGLPLDIEEIIQRFPKPQFGTHFEIYEQHCALESFNLRSLHKASNNEDFNTYVKWCESHAECHRLKLKDFLVMPMQRLTKYSLLISAILKETTGPTHRESLEHLVLEVSQFVQSVNQMVATQEETERVKEAMNQITGYNAVEFPSELKEVMIPYTHLDLLAPMPDVEVDKSRVLMLEGNLKYREQHNTNRMVVHVFLFTDMLLLTKPIRRSAGKHYTIVKPPYKITYLMLHSSEPGSFCVLVLNEYRLITEFFTLKADSEVIAKEWMKQINAAQQFYTEAVERKAQNWKLIQSLRSERILNGIEQHLDSLSMATNLSQSLWSINSNQSHQSRSVSLTTSIESIPGRHSPPILSEHNPVGRTLSAGTKVKLHSHPNIHPNGKIDFSASLPSWLERTSSLNTLFEKPESGLQGSLSNSCQRIKKMVASGTRTFPRLRSKSIEPVTQSRKPLAELFKLPSRSPISDSGDSGSESDPAIIDMTTVEEGEFISDMIGRKGEDDALCKNGLEFESPTSTENTTSKNSSTDKNLKCATPFKPTLLSDTVPVVTTNQSESSQSTDSGVKDCVHEFQHSSPFHEKIGTRLPNSMPEQTAHSTSDVVLVESNHSKSSPSLAPNSIPEQTAHSTSDVLVESNHFESSPFLEKKFPAAEINSVVQNVPSSPVSVHVQSFSESESTLAKSSPKDKSHFLPLKPISQIPSPAKTSPRLSLVRTLGTSESLPHTTPIPSTPDADPQKLVSTALSQIPSPAKTSPQLSPMRTSESLPHTTPIPSPPDADPQKLSLSQIPSPAKTSPQLPPMRTLGTSESLPPTTSTPDADPQNATSKPKVTFSDEARHPHKMQRSASDTVCQFDSKSYSAVRRTSVDRRPSPPVFSRSMRSRMGRNRHVPPAPKRSTGKSVKELSQIFEEATTCTESKEPTTKQIATAKISATIASSSKPAVKPKSTASTGVKGAAGYRRSDASKKRPEVATKLASRPHQSKSVSELRRSSTIGASSTTASQRRVSQPARAEISTKQPTQGILRHKKSTTSGTSSSKPAKTAAVTPVSSANSSMQQRSINSLSKGKKSKATIHTQGQAGHVVQVSAIRAIKGRKSPVEWDNFGLSWSNAGRRGSRNALDPHTHSDCSFVTTTVTVVVQPEH